MIKMLVTCRIAAGKEQDFESIFAARRRIVKETEPETLEYDLFRAANDPLVYVVVESYLSDESFKAHLANSRDHEAMLACFDGRPKAVTLSPVDDVPKVASLFPVIH